MRDSVHRDFTPLFQTESRRGPFPFQSFAACHRLAPRSLGGLATQAALWHAHIAVDIAGKCFALGGGAALYETSPLQRRLRDMQAAAQHAALQERH